MFYKKGGPLSKERKFAIINVKEIPNRIEILLSNTGMFDFRQFIIDWKASVGSTLCDEMLTAPTFQRVKKEVDFVDLRSNFKSSIILPTQNSKSIWIWIANRKEDDIQLVNMMLFRSAHCASDVSLHLWCVRNSDVQNAVRSRAPTEYHTSRHNWTEYSDVILDVLGST